MTHEFTTYLNVCVIMLAIILFLLQLLYSPRPFVSHLCLDQRIYILLNYINDVFKLKCKSGCVKWSVNKLANIDLSIKRYIMIRLCTLQWSQFSYIPLTKKARWIEHTLGRLSKVFSLLLSSYHPRMTEPHINVHIPNYTEKPQSCK